MRTIGTTSDGVIYFKELPDGYTIQYQTISGYDYVIPDGYKLIKNKEKRMFGFKQDPRKMKRDKLNQEILDLELHKQKLEYDVRSIDLSQKQKELESNYKIKETQQKHDLELKRLKHEFEQEKKDWLKEKTDLLTKHEREMAGYKKEVDAKNLEEVTLEKLKIQQEAAQEKLNLKKEINDLKIEHSNNLAEVKAKAAEEYYDKMRISLDKMNTDGNMQTKFLKELTMQMLDKSPAMSMARIGAGQDCRNITPDKD